MEDIEEINSKVTETEAEEVYYASQRELIWRKFKKHKVAYVCGMIIIFMYLVMIFAKFVAPYDPNARRADRRFVPPQGIHFISKEGLSLRPFVYGLEEKIDPETFQTTYEINKKERYPLQFFVKGSPYKLWFLIPTDLHLFGIEGEEIVSLFGTDDLGRDVFSRVIYGARISMTIGLVGVFISFILGLTLGGISGYYGGLIDLLVQRFMEIIRCFPRIPLWMGLSAALPTDWSIIRIYFMITVILSMITWTGLARATRGKIMSLKDEDFVVAARLSGTSEFKIISVHLIPSFMSHIIAIITLRVPRMILAETALSFLGIGLRPPAISWGVLLQGAQNIHTVALAPWLLIPGLFVVLFVLAFNFTGDGLRDAADPYG